MIFLTTMFRASTVIVFLLWVTFCVPPTHADQSAEAIVAQNVKAQGGEKTLSRVQTIAI